MKKWLTFSFAIVAGLLITTMVLMVVAGLQFLCAITDLTAKCTISIGASVEWDRERVVIAPLNEA